MPLRLLPSPRTVAILIALLTALLMAPSTVTYAQEWAERGGGISTDKANDVAVDADGNSYAVGLFFQSATFGTGDNAITITSSDRADVFLAKYASDGTLTWVDHIGGPGSESGIGVAVDGSGNVYAAGWFSETATFGADADEVTLTSAGQTDVFIAKYSSDGTLMWAKRAGGNSLDQLGGSTDVSSSDAGDGLVVDASGNAYLTGHYFSNTATFGSGDNEVVLPNDEFSQGELFLAKYAPDGTLTWAQRAGGGSFGLDEGRDVALDGDGNLRLTGIIRDTAIFGSGDDEVTLTASGQGESFLAEYAPDGTLQWVKKAGDDTNAARVIGIAADGSGNTYLTGFFKFSDIILGTGAAATTLTNEGSEDIFLAKYDDTGALLWAQGSGSPDRDLGLDLAVDADGTLWLTGLFSETVTFGGGASSRTLADKGGRDAFVVHFDPSGTALDAQKIGGPAPSTTAAGNGIAAGSAFVGGDFQGTATFDAEAGRTLTSAGFQDAFLARYEGAFSVADLRVENEVDDAAPTEGDEITLTVTLSNDGPDNASRTQVRAPVPQGVTGGVTVTPSQGTYDLDVGVWDVGALASGANATLTITGTVRQSSSITSTATAAHSDQSDSDGTNNSASVTINPQLPPGSSLAVANTGNDGVGSLRNAIEVANSTPNDGSPDVITFDIDVSSDPGCNSSTGVCSIELAWALPQITEPVEIDGLSQDGADCSVWPATLKVVLDGRETDVNTNGIELSAGASTVRGLVFRGFDGASSEGGGSGLFIDSDANAVECNFFGTDAAGTEGGSDYENETGVHVRNGAANLIGGPSVSQRNLFGTQADFGILIEGTGATGNAVAGNFIGTDVTGTVSLSSTFGDGGIELDDAPGNIIGGSDHVAGVCTNSCNLISGNGTFGISIEGDLATGQTIAGNFIGTDITGTQALPNGRDGIEVDDDAGGHVIGGLSDVGVCSKACNLISGNDGDGIAIDDSDAGGNTIQGNFIGTDVDGSTALPNDEGIEIDNFDNTIGGATPGLGNLISGNERHGIDFSSDDGIIQGNLIGVAADSTSPLGNGGNGLLVSGDGTLVGGTGPGEANVIAFNGQRGIGSFSGLRNRFLGNSIFSNGDLGIDLGTTGATANDPGDADTGANNLQNFPDLTSATAEDNFTLNVEYSVDTAPANATYPITVHLYRADADDEEGQTYLGSVEYPAADAQTVTVDGLTPAVPLSDGDRVLATAMDDEGNTSEFSAPVTVNGDVPLPVELAGFEATLDGEDTARLTWQTASETNNAGFHVERSVTTGGPFEEIGFVEGAGTTTEARRYRFADRTLPFEAERLTYRLRQVDTDGTATLSEETILEIGAPETVVLHGVFPHPVQAQATLRYELAETGPVRIELYDLLGRRVQTLLDGERPAGRHETVVDASRLPSGVYFYRLTAGEQIKTERLTVQR